VNKAICHITPVSHLTSILHEGGLWCDKEAAARGLIKQSIAHDDIKRRRMCKPVPCGAGGVLADYVPFYFAPRSPMLGALHVGKVASYRDGQENIVHLVSTTKCVADEGLPFVFSDGHAPMALSRFFADLRRLDQIDWTVVSVKQRFWHDTPEDPDRSRRRQLYGRTTFCLFSLECRRSELPNRLNKGGLTSPARERRQQGLQLVQPAMKYALGSTAMLLQG